MTSRIGQPDTQADLELRACLDERPQRSFIMVAGAGSGKTTSLVKALSHLGQTRRLDLRRRGQRIACITYTEVAVKEIAGDVGNDLLFHVSTIHSFMWGAVRPFQANLKAWVTARIREKIAEAQEHYNRPRTRAATRETLMVKIARFQHQLDSLAGQTQFTYGAGSDYVRGVLGHADVIAAAVDLIEESQLLRDLVASRYPVVFVDESQDTRPEIVEAFRRIAETTPLEFCLGFFGDPMQKIYTDGAGTIDAPEDWRRITKPENFRCPQNVLRIVNGIRRGGDGLVQTRGRMMRINDDLVPLPGTAKIFLLLADDQRSEKLSRVRAWFRRTNNDELWVNPDRAGDVRTLVVVHRMAAARLRFPGVYAALNDDAPMHLKEGLKDGSAWPLQVFLKFLLPLALAVRERRQFEVISLLRSECELLSAARLAGNNAPAILERLRVSTEELSRLVHSDNVDLRAVLAFAFESQLVPRDQDWGRYFDRAAEEPAADPDPETPNILAFLACQVSELHGYRHYLEDLSPFATQQGVKGAEFERVIVLIDDEEGRSQRLFSYEKYFGIAPLSDTDHANIAEGSDNVVDRTRRLFYVCCSRAKRDLAIVMFVRDIASARMQIEDSGIFQAEDIVEELELEFE